MEIEPQRSGLISVIVPIYHVEEYMDECIDSIVNQTYKNLEIILVDDGSPDNCPTKCDQWAERDARIRVIHKKNGGLSSARNAGLDVAAGEYISFVDSDDFFDKRMYEILYEGITRSSNIGISAIKFYKYEDGKVSIYWKKWDTKEDVLVKSMDFGILTLKQKVCHAATNKLYRRELLENVRFREGKLNEDVLFMHDLSKEIQKQSLDMWDLAYYAYYYRLRQNSICHSDIPIVVAYIENLRTIVEEAESQTYKSTAIKIYRITICDFCSDLLKLHSTREGKALYDKYFARYKNLIRFSFYPDIRDQHRSSFITLITLILLKYSPKLYALIIRKQSLKIMSRYS